MLHFLRFYPNITPLNLLHYRIPIGDISRNVNHSNDKKELVFVASSTFNSHLRYLK